MNGQNSGRLLWRVNGIQVAGEHMRGHSIKRRNTYLKRGRGVAFSFHNEASLPRAETMVAAHIHQKELVAKTVPRKSD